MRLTRRKSLIVAVSLGLYHNLVSAFEIGRRFGTEYRVNCYSLCDQFVNRMYADSLGLLFSFLSLCLCLRLCCPGLPVQRNDAIISTSACKGMEIVPFSCACVCVVATYVPVSRENVKHKHKHDAGMLASHRFTSGFLMLMLMLMAMHASHV